MSEFSKKKVAVQGFTLVEVMVVLAIVGMLSIAAINGYSSYRRSALLDFAADNIVSQIGEMQEKTVHGVFGSDGDTGQVVAKCYGFYIGEDMGLMEFEQEFSSKKKWDSVSGEFVNSGCGDFAGLDGAAMDKEEIINVVSVMSNGEQIGDVEDVVFRFSPPSGVMDYKLGGVSYGDDVTFVLQYGEREEERKSVVLDLSSGKAKNVNYEE